MINLTKPLFGPAGSCNRFRSEGNLSSMQMPDFLKKNGLNAFEYQCGRGVRLSEDSAKKLGQTAKEFGIALSVHSPYFISISNKDPEKVENSINYVLQTLAIAKSLGAGRIVVHCGATLNRPRAEGMANSIDFMKRMVKISDEHGFGDINICPETMGKINQLGTLDETLELCKLDERLIPTIDFGHLNARTLGSINNINDYAEIIHKITNVLGAYRGKNFHCHFSKIEYTKGGERKHLTFADDKFGPDFSPLAELVAKENITPIFICESDKTQTDDAIIMRDLYESYCN